MNKKTLLLIGLVTLLLAALASAAYMMYKCLKSGTGTETFEQGPVKTVEYYRMDGCKYCAAFDPIWTAVESELSASEADTSINFVKWDVSTEEGKEKAKKAGVNAFPHVQKIGDDGEPVVFTESRTEKNLKDFCLN